MIETFEGATLVGITVRYLKMIEAGTRTPTLHVLRRITGVLRVRTSALLGEAPSENHEGPVNPRLAELQRAPVTYRTILLSESGELSSLEDLIGQVEATRQMWFTSPGKYSDALRVAPRSPGHALLKDDQPAVALGLAMVGAQKRVSILPDGRAVYFSLYGGLHLVATLGAL